jgi:ubiquitin-conjugating enzyme E2 O
LQHFEDFVFSHFRSRAHTILAACKAYTEGAPVGFVDNDGAQDNVGGDNRSIEFRSKLGKMMSMLITCFTKNGSTDTREELVAWERL